MRRHDVTATAMLFGFLAALTLGSGATADAQIKYTGCLKKNERIVRVAPGDFPKKPCKEKQTEFTFFAAEEQMIIDEHNTTRQNVADSEANIRGDLAALQSAVETLLPLCGIDSVGQRYAVDGSEVCDNKTGLKWQQKPGALGGLTPGTACADDGSGSPSPKCTWQQATAYCAALGNGYRLAELQEMQSLVDYSQPDPGVALNAGPFTGVQGASSSDNYWMATRVADQPSQAWILRFDTGYIGPVSETGQGWAWCAR